VGAYGGAVADELGAVAADLVRRLRNWSRRSWVAAAVGRAGTRADAVHACAQRLADIAAHAERRIARPLPRHSDLALPDQLAVLTDDIRRTADPEAARAAVRELLTLRQALSLR
jgi:hypothetical protein